MRPTGFYFLTKTITYLKLVFNTNALFSSLVTRTQWKLFTNFKLVSFELKWILFNKQVGFYFYFDYIYRIINFWNLEY